MRLQLSCDAAIGSYDTPLNNLVLLLPMRVCVCVCVCSPTFSGSLHVGQTATIWQCTSCFQVEFFEGDIDDEVEVAEWVEKKRSEDLHLMLEMQHHYAAADLPRVGRPP